MICFAKEMRIDCLSELCIFYFLVLNVSREHVNTAFGRLRGSETRGK